MFEPLGTLLSRFSVEMIDESIHKSCIVDKDNFYLHKTIQECFPKDEIPHISYFNNIRITYMMINRELG